MSLFRRLAAPIAFGLALTLGGCGLSPIYGDAAAVTRANLALRYAEPTNRYEQIVYQDLGFRLGKSCDPANLLVSVTIAKVSASLGATAQGGQFTTHQMVLVGSLVVTDPADGRVVYKTSRRAAAQYEVSPQLLVGSLAADEAAERAAHTLAESLRLALLSQLQPN